MDIEELDELDEGCITEDLYGLIITYSYVGLYSASNFEVFYKFFAKFAVSRDFIDTIFILSAQLYIL